MNTCFNLIKACLTPKVKNIFDWPRFLIWEALAYIYFLDFIIF